MKFSASIIRRHPGGSGSGYRCVDDGRGDLDDSDHSSSTSSRTNGNTGCWKHAQSKSLLLRLLGTGRHRAVVQLVGTTVVSTLVLLLLLLFLATHDLGQVAHSCKIAIKHYANAVWDVAEERGIIERAPAIITNYHDLYPEFKLLEAKADVIQAEFAQLWDRDKQNKDGNGGTGGVLIDMEHLNYNQKQLRYKHWKAFSLNVAGYLPLNTALMPQTTALLQRYIPDLHSAMFSVLGPQQTVGPHFGIWKGMRRYHLGITIVDDNKQHNQWLRVNPAVIKDVNGNSDSEKALAYDGEAYYWKNGEGVMFDDTYLHVARNEADELRVVLLIDVLRKGLPWYLNMYNRLAVWIAEHDTRVTAVQAKVSVKPQTPQQLPIAPQDKSFVEMADSFADDAIEPDVSSTGSESGIVGDAHDNVGLFTATAILEMQ